MKARTFKELSNNTCSVSIYTEDWSQLDLQLMAKYAEPEIDLGGTFEDAPLEFTLPNELVKIKSGSPFHMAFDYRDHADADARAELWTTEIIDRLTSAITTLRAHTDSFTEENVIQI